MMDVPRWLITAGLILIVIGVIWQFGGRFLPLGRLPGDFLFSRGNTTFYFPLMTSIIISIILSVLFYLFSQR
ncbi:DUF2905 domain-containing protein [Salisediminibacterium selenitireducens]|uniref:DUF2905 domain-containing protein n=1 Tax=Bacillus selenitireducens (strain ATCC 700615 / DSM 15326 / MLS10) TaxID=439292 RepID=D6XWZ4_BACIE|nr:DUF2905 domain-containing protein [Salisediminibacterium selenitireducens]ADH99970.1 conserved hypothetical protein [[Bacillus] selenitireducens MLS10]